MGILVISLFQAQPVYSQDNSRQPLNTDTAILIADGHIRLESGKTDTLLYTASPLNPSADNDGDGLKNSQEIYTYFKNGRQYYGYNSNPLLSDTDGDGIPDSEDRNPLVWDISTRDMAMFMELAYREDDYIRKVLDETTELTELYRDRKEYKMMHRELAPFWAVKSTHHLSKGFDAVLFETKSSYPYLQDGTVQVLGIRGTTASDAGDLEADANIFLGIKASQAYILENLLKELDNDKSITNLYSTGHSLGGYLSNWGLIHARNKGYNWYKKAYTFNAPKISGNFFNRWLWAESAKGDKLTAEGQIVHHIVSNDNVIRPVGTFVGAINIGESAGGHSSRSYFESRVNNIPGFAVGKRYGMDEYGYQDDRLKHIKFKQVFDSEVFTGNALEIEPVEVRQGEAVNLQNSVQVKNLPEGSVKVTTSFTSAKLGNFQAAARITFPDGSSSDVKIPVTVRMPQDIEVNFTGFNGTIYSTDKNISGTATPGARVELCDGADNSLGYATVQSGGQNNGKWTITLNQGVASEGASVSAVRQSGNAQNKCGSDKSIRHSSSATPAEASVRSAAQPKSAFTEKSAVSERASVENSSGLYLVQIKDGFKDPQKVPVKAELGSTEIQPFSQGDYNPNMLVAGQKTVQLKVPHDAGIVYVRVNDNDDGKQFNITRASARAAWTSSRNDISVQQTSTDNFHDTVAITFNTANSGNDPFVLQKDKKLYVVPHLNTSSLRSYWAERKKADIDQRAGQSVEGGFWLTRTVTNAAPTLSPVKASVDLPANAQPITHAQLTTLTDNQYVRIEDKEDKAEGAIIHKPDFPKLEVTEVKLGGKVQPNPQQVSIDQPGVYEVTFKGYDSQGLESNEQVMTFRRALTDVTVDARGNRIYSTDRVVEGTGVPGATVIVKDGADELGRAEVGSNNKWTVTLSRGVASTHKVNRIRDADHPRPVKTPSNVKVMQQMNGVSSAEVSLGVELGSTQIEPFAHGTYKPNKLIAGQKTVRLKVPHDAGLVYVKVNGTQFNLTRAEKDSDWVSSRTDVTVTTDRTDQFHDRLTLTFTNAQFVLANNGTLAAVPHLRKGPTFSVYAAHNRKAVADRGETVTENRWVTRAVTNEKPVVSKVQNAASFAAGSTVSVRDLIQPGMVVNVADKEDDILNAVIPQQGLKDLFVTKVVAAAGQAASYELDADSQNRISFTGPGVYTVTFQARDSQGLLSDTVEVQVSVAVAQVAVTPTASDGRVYSTDEKITGTGGYPGATLTVKQDEMLLGTGTVAGNDSWTVNLTAPMFTSFKCGDKCIKGARSRVTVEQSINGVSSVSGGVDVELGGSRIEKFAYAQSEADGVQPVGEALVAGQKEVFVRVPHDAGMAYVKGLKAADRAKHSFLKAVKASDGRVTWQAMEDDRSIAQHVTVVEEEPAGDAIADAVYTRLKLTFNGSGADGASSFAYFPAEGTQVGVKTHLYHGGVASAYRKNSQPSEPEATFDGDGWVVKSVVNQAPKVSLADGKGSNSVQAGTILNYADLVKPGTYVKYADREDDTRGVINLPGRVFIDHVIEPDEQNLAGKKIVRGKDSSDNLTIAKSGVYTVVFKAVDSQGKESVESVAVRFENLAALQVLTVDQIATNAVKGAKLTLYKANAQGEFEEKDEYRIGQVDEKTLADNATVPAVWENLPAGVYFVKVSPDSKSRYDAVVHKVQHQAVADGVPHKLAMPRSKTPVEWKKIAKNTFSSPLFLAGSQWCVLPVRDNKDDARAHFVTLDKFGLPAVKETGHICEGGVLVADNSSGSDASGDDLPAGYVKDVNPDPGYIQVELPWVNFGQWYVLKEVKAPFLYQVTNDTKPIHVDSAGQKVSFHLDRFGQWDYSDLNKTAFIENERIPVVGVLLDSGVRYLLWALLVAGVAGVWFVVSARRRAAQASRLD